MTDYRWLFEGLAVAASSVVFLGGAMLLYGAFRTRSAAFRHLVLLGAFAGLLVLPALSLVLPTWCLPASPCMPARGPAGAGASDVGPRVVAAVEPSTFARIERPDPRARTGFGDAHAHAGLLERARRTGLGDVIARHLSLIAAALWAFGAGGVVVTQIVRWTAAGALAGTASPIEDESLRSLAERIRRELGVEKRAELLLSETAPVSMVWGLVRPRIVLPAELVEWTAGKTEAVLRHELAHVKRNDNLFHLIAGLACAVYWFNPLVWTALRRLHFEREVACDDCVLEAGTAASAYAKHLMEVSMNLNGPKRMRIVPAAMAHSSDVKRRLLHVLDPRMKRRPAGTGSMFAVLLLAVCFAAPVSAFRIWSDEAPAPPVRPGPVSRPAPTPLPAAAARPAELAAAATPVEAPSVAEPVAPAPDAPLALPTDENDLWSINGTIKTGKERVAVEGTMENEARHLTVKAAHVVFEPGLPHGFRFDSRKGLFVVTERSGRDELVYEAKPKGSGIQVTLTINGEKRDFDDSRREDLKAIAGDIFDTLAGDGMLDLRTGSLASGGREADWVALGKDKDILIAGADSLQREKAVVLRKRTGGNFSIVRARPDEERIRGDAERLAREYARAAREVDRIDEHRLAREYERSAREVDRIDEQRLAREYERSARERGRAGVRARADADRVSRDALRIYSEEAGAGDDIAGVLELFRDQRESILAAMERLDGDAREEYRETVIASYEKMIDGIDEKIAKLEADDSADRSVERRIELYTKLRDGLKETIAKLKRM
jgi:beta-lactamase regulating signal transducer with metallopeptidase domain